MTVPVASVVERLPGLRTALVLATVVGVSSLAIDASAQQAGMPGGDTENRLALLQEQRIERHGLTSCWWATLICQMNVRGVR